MCPPALFLQAQSQLLIPGPALGGPSSGYISNPLFFEGYLCGKCRGDKGVSVLLNKCVSCGYGSIALIFGLG